jgi:hypothetical protein
LEGNVYLGLSDHLEGILPRCFSTEDQWQLEKSILSHPPDHQIFDDQILTTKFLRDHVLASRSASHGAGPFAAPAWRAAEELLHFALCHVVSGLLGVRLGHVFALFRLAVIPGAFDVVNA